MNRQRELFAVTLLILLWASSAMFSQAQGQAASAPPPPVSQPVVASAAPAPQPATVPATGKLVLREGTDVKLKFTNDLSSKTAEEGDPVNLILDEDIKVGDVVVAKAGCKAVGEITNAKKAGMMGKAGELNLRLEHLTVGDQRVRLRGSKGKEGEGKVGTAVALTVLFGPIGLIKHGKNVEVKAGTPLTAFVDEDAPLGPSL
ncbi:MAG: hypothetical protein ACYDDS_01640 [Candidatus Sulfotelmatobacter sp.]|jgi:hypothetical protein